MKKKQVENDLSEWLSTYGLVTAERILENYKIKLEPEDLITAIKSANTFYHQVLRVPLKNVLNGIILQQAYEYQVYAQKLFIDYLLSGETTKEEESPGGSSRDILEKERQKLMKMAEDFHNKENEHQHLIAESQKALIKLTEQWNQKLQKAAKRIKSDLSKNHLAVNEKELLLVLNHLIMQDLSKESGKDLQAGLLRIETFVKEQLPKQTKELISEEIESLMAFVDEKEKTLNPFFDRIALMNRTLREFRTQFYDLILKVTRLIKNLPEYRVDPLQQDENRASLYFDTSIGED